MNFIINKTVHKSFGQTVEEVTAALKDEGFGVITEIDLQEKFKEKMALGFGGCTTVARAPGMPRKKKWDDVLAKLSPLSKQDGVYLAAESAPDSYINPQYKTDHPSVLGAFGMLPKNNLLDTAVTRHTFDLIWNSWTWPATWGWDFPMTAMTATRLGLPDKGMDALFVPVKTNSYLRNGHNYQDHRLTLYMPGNGGLLMAVSMMVAGYDGSPVLPGIPRDGK